MVILLHNSSNEIKPWVSTGKMRSNQQDGTSWYALGFSSLLLVNPRSMENA